jgi:hypothetical protein
MSDEYTPTDAAIERLTLVFCALTHEGRSGFTWPLNREHDRQRAMADARAILLRVIGDDISVHDAEVVAAALQEAADEIVAAGNRAWDARQPFTEDDAVNIIRIRAAALTPTTETEGEN